MKMYAKKRAVSPLVAASLLLTFSGAAEAFCWTEECEAMIRKQRNEAVVDKNLQDIQKSVSAFYGTLGLKNEQTKAGLTIAWRSSQFTASGHSAQPLRQFDQGYAVATGQFSGEGCPEFEVTVLERYSGTHGDRIRPSLANRFICPN